MSPESSSPESYRIDWAASALRSLDRLAEKIATACVEFIYGGLAENPHRVCRPLRFDLEGLHSARRGAFGVICAVDDEHRIVTIVAIAHRSDVYRPR